VSESRAGDDADPPVSAPQQHRHHLRRGTGVVRPQRRYPVELRSGQDRRHALVAKLGDGALELTGGRGVLEAAAGQHQPIDAVVAQRLHLAQQLVGGAVGAADEHQVAAGGGSILQPADDLAKIRIGDVVHQHPDDARLAAHQRSGECGGRVV